MVMTGRDHQGDENGDTKYRCSRLSVLGTGVKVSPAQWSHEYKESNSDFRCAPDMVMVGRLHHGDENGQTKYLCATLSTHNDRSMKLVDEESHEVKESHGAYSCPPNKVRPIGSFSRNSAWHGIGGWSMTTQVC
jgi:hypothetical protein